MTSEITMSEDSSDDPDKDLLARLHALGFRTGGEALRAWLRDAHRQRLGPTETVERLLELERRTREANNLARRTHLAMIGTPKPLDHFDWSHPRAIDRGLYESLLTMDFLRTGENVLLRGPSGVGKTTLAQHLGLAALARGHTVHFATLSTAMADLLKQESVPATERRLKRSLVPGLLVLDEIGYLPCESRAADLLYTIVSRRHERRSTVVSTNLGYKQWATIFPSAACVGALVDRFAQHCHTLDIDADSWRKKGRR
jgi:DNA replication protein DnaC